jgi:hypothetical protein
MPFVFLRGALRRVGKTASPLRVGYHGANLALRSSSSAVIASVASRVLLLAALPGFTARASGQAERFEACFRNGERTTGREVRAWSGPGAQPSIDDRKLFDPANPVRWLIDHRLPAPAEPAAFVDLFGGDRLPGRVTAFRSGNESPLERQLPCFLVEPTVSLDWPDGPRRSTVRVTARRVKRIVWEPRPGIAYRPGTVFHRDRRVQRFRSARWSGESVLLLLAEGSSPATANVPIADLAEIHFPRADAWELQLEEVAALSPSCDSTFFEIETDGGLQVTCSSERFLARSHGPDNEPRNWYHAVQPAWSVDPLWIPHTAIRTRRFFKPWEVPLSRLEPDRVREKHAFGASWTWKKDRNVQGGLLRSDGRSYAWGIGVQASCDLEYDLPACATAFRAQVGIDEAVGGGGCARAAILFDRSAPALRGGREREQLFRSPLLIGSRRTLDSGRLRLEPPARGAREGGSTLLLSLDDAHEGRPPGADPFDVRDCVDWLEPLLELDPDALRAEARLRMGRVVPAFQDWTIDGADGAPVMLANRMADGGARWWLEVAPALPFLRIERTLRDLDGSSWLCLALRRDLDRSSSPRVRVNARGRLLADFEVPVRLAWSDAEPVLVPLRGLKGEARVEIVQMSGGSGAGVEWGGIAVLPLPPGLVRLHDGAPQPVEASAARFPGLELRVREQPQLGEARFIRFAWKAPEGGQVSLKLGHDGTWGAEVERKGRSFLYRAGGDARERSDARVVAGTAPREWTVVVRDLYEDFGSFTLTGLAFSSEGGPASFDGVYLARSRKEFDWLKEGTE